MRFIVCLTIAVLAIACQTTVSSEVKSNVEKQIPVNSADEKSDEKFTAIRQIDFQNFTFPWTKTFGDKGKTFTLKNGIAELADERKISLQSLSYIDAAQDYDEQALIVVNIDNGNASYQMLYVFAIENSKPKLLESFEFGEDNIFLELRSSLTAN